MRCAITCSAAKAPALLFASVAAVYVIRTSTSDAATVAAASARRPGESRLVAAYVDASDPESVAALAREHRATHVFNAVDPRFVMPIFTGARAAGAHYLDMAMSLSKRHPERRPVA